MTSGFVFNELQLANDFISQINLGENYPNEETKTQRFCIARKHFSKNLWFVISNEVSQKYANGLQDEEITEDWFPSQIRI